MTSTPGRKMWKGSNENQEYCWSHPPNRSSGDNLLHPESVLGRYQEVRDQTEALAAALTPEDQTVQSMPDASPTKWHRAHTTWFFEMFLLAEFQANFCAYSEGYPYLFNSYYEALGPRYPRPQRGLVTRPSASEVGAYRQSIDGHVAALLNETSGTNYGAVANLVELGINHEQQHQELLLMDIKHVLSFNPLRPAAYPALASAPTEPEERQPARSQQLAWTDFDGGVQEIGHPGGSFAFDNEGPRHRVFTEPFRIANNLVTVGQWLEFMADGGYERPELWLFDGWNMVRQDGWQAPLYWVPEGDGWQMHTLTGTRPILADEPVCHLSYFEAEAFATWADKRLPTEAEWELAATSALNNIDPRSDGGGHQFHPKPACGTDGFLNQLFTDCWQWTSSAYSPYPGFQSAKGAVGEYNGKFMSGQMVLRGGCALTPAGHSRPTYRNFYPPHSRWMMSGLRLVEDAGER